MSAQAIDPIQILLTVIITTLTVLLVIIGIEVFQILKEVKKNLEKLNVILDNAQVISRCLVEPVEEASSFFHGIKKGVDFFKFFSKLLKEDND